MQVGIAVVRIAEIRKVEPACWARTVGGRSVRPARPPRYLGQLHRRLLAPPSGRGRAVAWASDSTLTGFPTTHPSVRRPGRTCTDARGGKVLVVGDAGGRIPAARRRATLMASASHGPLTIQGRAFLLAQRARRTGGGGAVSFPPPRRRHCQRRGSGIRVRLARCRAAIDGYRQNLTAGPRPVTWFDCLQAVADQCATWAGDGDGGWVVEYVADATDPALGAPCL